MVSDNDFKLDLILNELGSFGKFQIYSILLISIPIGLSAIFTLSYVFTAGNLDYRCHIPECERSQTTDFNPIWLQFAVPYVNDVPARCERYTYHETDTNETCGIDNFNLISKYKCNEFIYLTNEKTIVNDFNLTCEDNDWKLALVGTVNNIGQFFCLTFTGYVSDRYGRKIALILGLTASCIFGFLRSFSINYEMFLTMEFLDPFLGSGIYSAGYILAMEIVEPHKRVLGATILCYFYAIGEALLGLAAMFLPNWRTLLRVVYLPGLLCLSYYWLLPESVRWLITKGRMDEATKIIKKIAIVNQVELSQKSLDTLENKRLIDSYHLQVKEEERLVNVRECINSDKYPMITVIKTPFMLWRVANCSFCWLANTFVYFGLSLNSVLITGNKHLNYILVCLIEIPGFFVTYLILDRLGRRKSLFLALMLSGISCIITNFIPEHIQWLQLLLFLIGKFAITISFTILYVYTTEIFPTNLRHSLLATCSMFGRIGSMIAPQTPLLARYFPSLPLLLFGGVAITSGVLILSLPETLNTKLPDTIEEARNINKNINRTKTDN